MAKELVEVVKKDACTLILKDTLQRLTAENKKLKALKSVNLTVIPKKNIDKLQILYDELNYEQFAKYFYDNLKQFTDVLKYFENDDEEEEEEEEEEEINLSKRKKRRNKPMNVIHSSEEDNSDDSSEQEVDKEDDIVVEEVEVAKDAEVEDVATEKEEKTDKKRKKLVKNFFPDKKKE